MTQISNIVTVSLKHESPLFPLKDGWFTFPFVSGSHETGGDEWSDAENWYSRNDGVIRPNVRCKTFLWAKVNMANLWETGGPAVFTRFARVFDNKSIEPDITSTQSHAVCNIPTHYVVAAGPNKTCTPEFGWAFQVKAPMHPSVVVRMTNAEFILSAFF